MLSPRGESNMRGNRVITVNLVMAEGFKVHSLCRRPQEIESLQFAIGPLLSKGKALTRISEGGAREIDPSISSEQAEGVRRGASATKLGGSFLSAVLQIQ